MRQVFTGLAAALCLLPARAALAQPTAAAVNDQLFAMAAAEGGMAEVTTAQMALQRSKNEEVRRFAQELINDHTQANQELKTVASTRRISLPPTPGIRDQAAADRLNGLQGAEFDREFCKLQLVAHMDAVALFEAEASRGRDAELKGFASRIVPKLKQHLEMARRLAGEPGASGPSIIEEGKSAAPATRRQPANPSRQPDRRP